MFGKLGFERYNYVVHFFQTETLLKKIIRLRRLLFLAGPRTRSVLLLYKHFILLRCLAQDDALCDSDFTFFLP